MKGVSFLFASARILPDDDFLNVQVDRKFLRNLKFARKNNKSRAELLVLEKARIGKK